MASEFKYIGAMDVLGNSSLTPGPEGYLSHGTKVDFGDDYVGISSGRDFRYHGTPVSAPTSIQLWKLTPEAPIFVAEFLPEVHFGGTTANSVRSFFMHHAMLTTTKAICISYTQSGRANYAMIVERVGETLNFGSVCYFVGDEDTPHSDPARPGGNQGFLDPDNPISGSNYDSAYLGGSAMVLAVSPTSAVVAAAAGWYNNAESWGLATRMLSIDGLTIIRVKKADAVEPPPTPPAISDSFAAGVIGSTVGQATATGGATWLASANPGVVAEAWRNGSGSLRMAGPGDTTKRDGAAYLQHNYPGSYRMSGSFTVEQYNGDDIYFTIEGKEGFPATDINASLNVSYGVGPNGSTTASFAIRYLGSTIAGGSTNLLASRGFNDLGTYYMSVAVTDASIEADLTSPQGWTQYLSVARPATLAQQGVAGVHFVGNDKGIESSIRLLDISLEPEVLVKREGGWHLNPSTGPYFSDNQYGWLYGACVLGQYGFVLGWDWDQKWSIHRIDMATSLVTTSITPVGPSPNDEYYAGTLVAVDGKLLCIIFDWDLTGRFIVKTFNPTTLVEETSYELLGGTDALDRAYAQDWQAYEGPNASFQGGSPWVFFNTSSDPQAEGQEIANGPTIIGPAGVVDTADHQADGLQMDWDEAVAVVNDLYLIGGGSASWTDGRKAFGVFYRQKELPPKYGLMPPRVFFDRV